MTRPSKRGNQQHSGNEPPLCCCVWGNICSRGTLGMCGTACADCCSDAPHGLARCTFWSCCSCGCVDFCGNTWDATCCCDNANWLKGKDACGANKCTGEANMWKYCFRGLQWYVSSDFYCSRRCCQWSQCSVACRRQARHRQDLLFWFDLCSQYCSNTGGDQVRRQPSTAASSEDGGGPPGGGRFMEGITDDEEDDEEAVELQSNDGDNNPVEIEDYNGVAIRSASIMDQQGGNQHHHFHPKHQAQQQSRSIPSSSLQRSAATVNPNGSFPSSAAARNAPPLPPAVLHPMGGHQQSSSKFESSDEKMASLL